MLNSEHDWWDLCGLPLMAHCQWTLIIHNYSSLAPYIYGIDPALFNICGQSQNFNLVNLFN